MKSIMVLIFLSFCLLGFADSENDYRKIKTVSDIVLRNISSLGFDKIIASGYDYSNSSRSYIVSIKGSPYLIRYQKNILVKIPLSDKNLLKARNFGLYGNKFSYAMLEKDITTSLYLYTIVNNKFIANQRINLNLKELEGSYVKVNGWSNNKILLKCNVIMSGPHIVYKLLDLNTRHILNYESGYYNPIPTKVLDEKNNKIIINESQHDLNLSWYNRLHVINLADLSSKLIIKSKKIHEDNPLLWLNNNEIAFATYDRDVDTIDGLWKVNYQTGQQTQIFNFAKSSISCCISLPSSKFLVVERKFFRSVYYLIDKNKKYRIKNINIGGSVELSEKKNILVIDKKRKEIQLFGL